MVVKTISSIQTASSLTRRRFSQSLLSAACLVGQNIGAKSKGDGRHLRYSGIALAGAEFGEQFPGQLGQDYIYPDFLDYQFVASQGFNVVRLPFRWERLQPILSQNFSAAEWSQIKAAIRITRKLGLNLILDPHNYARRRTSADGYIKEHLIGTAEVPVRTYVEFWKQLSRLTKMHRHVIYSLMNEPADIAAIDWLDIVNRTVTGIRETGADQLILVPGTAYTGAHSWFEAGNTVLEAVHDSAQNYAIEVHQYLDADSSGQFGTAVSRTVGVERLNAFQAWARSHRLRAFLGEFGAGRDPVSLQALESMVQSMESNRDVWIGWAAWAGGPWWPDNAPLRLSPRRSGEIPPQTVLLSKLAKDWIAD